MSAQEPKADEISPMSEKPLIAERRHCCDTPDSLIDCCHLGNPRGGNHGKTWRRFAHAAVYASMCRRIRFGFSPATATSAKSEREAITAFPLFLVAMTFPTGRERPLHSCAEETAATT